MQQETMMENRSGWIICGKNGVLDS